MFSWNTALLLSVLLGIYWLYGLSRRRIKPPLKILLHTKDSFEEIWIAQTGSLRSLHFASPENHMQTACDLLNPRHILFDYQKMIVMATALYFPPRRIALIGLGGGSLSLALRLLYPQAHITHIEINPRMLDYAKRFFHFQEDILMDFHIADAATFFQSEIGRSCAPFDIIILDAFDRTSTPVRFFNRTFYHDLLNKLTPQGMLLGNTYYHSQWKDREENLYQQIFPKVISSPPLAATEGNRVLIAFKATPSFERTLIQQQIQSLSRTLQTIGVSLPQWESWLWSVVFKKTENI